MLPWSDPVSWTDAAGLPSGAGIPGWVEVIRAALAVDPDQRPTAEEFAAGMRSGADPADEPAAVTRVDLRGLIPREVRRLAAYSVDAMNDGNTVVARATPPPIVTRRRSADGRVIDLPPDATAMFSRITAPAPADAPTTLLPLVAINPPGGTGATAETATGGPTSDERQLRANARRDNRGRRRKGTAPRLTSTTKRTNRRAVSSTQCSPSQPRPLSSPPRAPSCSAAARTPGRSRGHRRRLGRPPRGRRRDRSPGPTATPTLSRAQLLAGARQAGQQFLHNVGVRSDLACAGVIGVNVVTTKAGHGPISCAALLATRNRCSARGRSTR